MDLAVLSGILASITSLCGLLLAIFVLRKTNSKLEVFEDVAASVSEMFRYETDENDNVLLDARVVKMIETLSSGMAKSLQMSFLGKLSGPARLDKGLKGAIASDIVEEKMPMVSLIGDFLGVNTKKYIQKHPEAMMQLSQMVLPMLTKTGVIKGMTQNSSNDGVGIG